MSIKVDDKESGLSVAMGFLATPFLAVWWAYVLTVMWGWFIVPLGLHAIGKAHAYGLVVLVGMLKARAPKKGEQSAPIAATLVFSALGPAVSLLCGWIAHSLMGGTP
jgi:hypothetical protein